MKDYYKILQLNKNASEIDVKKSFRKKALLTHPDKTKRDSKQQFLDIYEAYSVLSDQKKRAKYDQFYKQRRKEVDRNMAEPELDLVSISEHGKAYAANFQKFNREFLFIIILEILLGSDRLLYAAFICIILGLWTVISGIIDFRFTYSLVGLGLASFGLYLAILKINRIDY
ncbi:DnaJ domain-containing protein [Marivirga harenae]|uniref:J domain-containing protein n=1 Tax=Marivirga harenae TaxID=2010992 RepID=UPI0026E073A7|nr:DnaJ domain-containing protein [Marivirga harenae]WKV11835.1 DnaJ domain-containing protein [Marivirga harenae]|tara:strand:+ start:9567 stop:10079 length:513 start_codon:yes stop_codon:yes gene_type:complete